MSERWQTALSKRASGAACLRSGVLRRFRCSEPCPKLGWPNAVTRDVAFIEPGKFPCSQVDKLFYVARINDRFRARTNLPLSRALPIPHNPPDNVYQRRLIFHPKHIRLRD